MNIAPIQIIAAVNVGIINAEKRFTNGGCFQLYRVLKHIYPKAVAWYVHGHVYTEIEGMFYDINGVIEKLPDGAIPLESEYLLFAKAHRWDFS